MAKRYYLSPVIGDGSRENSYRPSMEDLLAGEDGSSGSWEIASNDDGTPKYKWALCVVDAQDHVRLRGGNGIDALPDITMDATLNTISSGQRTALLARLSALGVDTSGIVSSATFFDLLQRVGGHLNANFHALRFDAKAK